VGILGFLGSLTFFVIVVGILFVGIDVFKEVAPDEVQGDVQAVDGALWFLKPRVGLEYAPLLLLALLVIGLAQLVFKHRNVST
jgi:hypothetical protein